MDEKKLKMRLRCEVPISGVPKGLLFFKLKIIIIIDIYNKYCRYIATLLDCYITLLLYL